MRTGERENTTLRHLNDDSAHDRKCPRPFRDFAKGKREWADVLALLPTGTPRKKPGKIQRRWPNLNAGATMPLYARRRDLPVYGNPTQFRWLAHEPVNEQGVVLLFGMLAKDLGYMIENVQKSFPDCEAKRQTSRDRWQRVRIEFEFESRNYREHGHPTSDRQKAATSSSAGVTTGPTTPNTSKSSNFRRWLNPCPSQRSRLRADSEKRRRN